MTEALARVEAIVDGAGVAEGIEACLPAGVRRRQLSVRTLLVGILLALMDGRPAQLVRVHRALLALGVAERLRLGVVARWRGGPHLLTYRQVEHTFSVVVRALSKDAPDGAPPEALSFVIDALCEASVPEVYKQASTLLAVDWSDHESFSSPPPTAGGTCADPEASWGHRRQKPGQDPMFFGYYLQAVTMVPDEAGPPVPELVRRIVVSSCRHDAPPLLVPALARLIASGVKLGDVLCDSGYAHRIPGHWALPVRRLGATLVMDLHPHDRGTRGTFQGAVVCNGALYCPATPAVLLAIEPLSRSASQTDIAAHDQRTGELARYKLGRASTTDSDGYHRVMCPAALAKVRCPARGDSMTLPFDRPQIAAPPEPIPPCCSQKTITVPPEVNAKTAQKHDYPSKAHRLSFARRTAVERSYSTLKDPASTDTTRGWCRVMGLCAVTLLLACGVVVRNVRVADAFEKRQHDDARRRAAGLPPRVRKRRRRTWDELVEELRSA